MKKYKILSMPIIFGLAAFRRLNDQNGGETLNSFTAVSIFK